MFESFEFIFCFFIGIGVCVDLYFNYVNSLIIIIITIWILLIAWEIVRNTGKIQQIECFYNVEYTLRRNWNWWKCKIENRIILSLSLPYSVKDSHLTQHMHPSIHCSQMLIDSFIHLNSINIQSTGNTFLWLFLAIHL